MPATVTTRETWCNGLSSTEAARRLASFGANTLPQPARPNVARRLLRQLTSPLVALLALAAALSLALGNRLDAAVILIVVVINALLGFFEEARAESAARALRDVLRPHATVQRDGRLVELDASQIVPGDLVVVRGGDRIPADARIAHADTLELDESLITGESLPVARDAGDVLAGTTVTRGIARLVITATGGRTELGAIVASAVRTRHATPLEQRLAMFSRDLMRAGVALCGALAAVAWAKGSSLGDALLTGVALAVAAVPEGLPAVVSVTLAIGVRRMAHHGAIVRRLHAVETLGSTTVICTDKTGTLTENRMGVERICDAHGTLDAAFGLDLAPALANVLRAAAIACEAPLDGDPQGRSVDPTEAAVLDAAAAIGFDRGSVTVLGIEPFDSDCQRVTALVELDNGTRAVYMKGAPEALAPLLNDADAASALLRTAAHWAGTGLRVLLIAYGDDSIGAQSPQHLEPLGLVGIGDTLRAGIAQDIACARGAGIRTIMITGDHPATAVSVAQRVDLTGPAPRVLTGAEISELDDDALLCRLRDVEVIARVRPQHKLRIVELLRADGETVAMTGDGINDVPALRAADIGVAMGRRGSDAAAEASDMVLADDDYHTIVHAIKRGRATYDDVVRAVHFLLAANAGEVAVFALALPLGLGAPLTVLQILLMNLLTDGLPAVALAADPPDPNVMQRPPRPRREGLIAPLRARLVAASVATGLAGFAAYAIGRADSQAVGQTMAFTTLVAAQLSYVLSVRGSGWPWRAGRNRWLIAALLLSVTFMAAVLAAQALREAFDVARISVWQLTVALVLSGLPLTIAEIVKWRARGRAPCVAP